MLRSVLLPAALIGVLATSAFGAKKNQTMVPFGKSEIAVTFVKGRTTINSIQGGAVTVKGKLVGQTRDGRLVLQKGREHFGVDPRTGATLPMFQASPSVMNELLMRKF